MATGDEVTARRALEKAAELLARGKAGRARRWLRRAGDATADPRTSYLVGHAFHTRVGDLDLAQVYYRPAALAGHVDAMNNLGVVLKQLGLFAEAGGWLRAAAAQGDLDATHTYARLLHQSGRLDEALPWYEKAATAGHVDGMMNAGTLRLADGDRVAAFKWFRAAERAGHPLGGVMAESVRKDAGAPRGRPKKDAPNRVPPSRAPLLRAPARTPPPEPAAPLTLDPATPLASALQAQDRYLSTGDPRFLAMGIGMVTELLRTDLPRTERADAFTLHGVLLRTRYERDAHPADLQAAITAGRAAISYSRPTDPAFASHLSSLGNTLYDEYTRTRQLFSIDEAVALQRRALDLLPDEHSERVPTQSNLANALLARATAGDGPPDEDLLTESVLASREVVGATPEGHPRRASYLVNLAAGLLTLLRARPSQVIADEAAATYDRALRALPAGHPSRAGIEANRRLAHRTRDALRAAGPTSSAPSPPQATGTGLAHPFSDQQILDALRTAGILQDTPPPRPTTGTDAADQLLVRYETTGAAADLDRALGIYRAAHADARDPAARREIGVKLATALWSLAERTGARADLDEALNLFAALLAEMPATDPLAGTARTSLGSLYRLRWEQVGDPDDLDIAVRHQRAALARTKPGHPMRALRLDALASALTPRHEAYGDTAALEEALTYRRQALDLLGLASPHGPGVASNLAIGLRMRPGVSHADLDEAVTLARAAVTATPPGHLLHARFLSNLAICLGSRHAFTGDPADAEEAARHAAQAVAVTPLDHPNRVTRLGSLATSRALLHEISPTPAGLDDLIRAARQAEEAAPRGHISHTHLRSLHAWALARKAIEAGDDDLLAASEETLRQAATNPTGPIRERVAAARRWAAVAYLGHGPDAALGPFALAVELLARTAPRRIGRADQERHLASFGGLASDAAACAVACGDPTRALALLEAGRGVLLGQTFDTRGDLTRLREAHPEAARELTALRAVLDPAPGPGPGSVHTPDDRHAAAQAWDSLVADVRRRPGFADFLLPPEPADLVAALPDRTVVAVVNISGLRSDALLLAHGRVTALPLPAMDLATVTERADAFHTAVAGAAHSGLSRAARITHQRTIRDTLAWLWHGLAEPVLSALGHTAPPADGADAWPRLCWVPTGPLTALPLHAAEAAERADGAVLDRVISSYAPTLRSLLRAPAARDVTPAGADPLVVALPTTPGAPDLPYVPEEAAHLTSLRPGARVLSGQDATRDALLATLPAHDWVHLACHAQSPDAVLLHDHRTRRLTVPDIAALRLPSARLAYLSACATTLARPDLADEAVHITGAFQLAGYPHVVGTLWPVSDRLAPEAARAFYLAWDAGADPGRALHEAVRELRERYGATPTLWAAHVHVSAAG
ncbi:CHAT domain-containing protein [Streptomyces avicenniae]|uniref:CHAT domain-containing protein n=1 Tax=Streptomyces avicenniae TaxID=500153 RepID=UPI00069ADF1C|nr:CHAT domain-containing protein [Streptomyces avicenniae]